MQCSSSIRKNSAHIYVEICPLASVKIQITSNTENVNKHASVYALLPCVLVYTCPPSFKVLNSSGSGWLCRDSSRTAICACRHTGQGDTVTMCGCTCTCYYEVCYVTGIYTERGGGNGISTPPYFIPPPPPPRILPFSPNDIIYIRNMGKMRFLSISETTSDWCALLSHLFLR